MINFDQSQISLTDFKNKITELYNSFGDDFSDNFQKFYQFCHKLDDGILVWKWRYPYPEQFGGFYSKNMSFFGTTSRTNEEAPLFKHITLYPLSRNGERGRLNTDCNLQIYYLPVSGMQLIKDIYDDLVVPYYAYEDSLDKLSPIVKKIIKHRDIETEDEAIEDYFNDYFNKNLKDYQHFIVN